MASEDINMTLDERKLMGHVTMTVRVKPNRWRGPGIVALRLAAWLLGIKRIVVESDLDEKPGDAAGR